MGTERVSLRDQLGPGWDRLLARSKRSANAHAQDTGAAARIAIEQFFTRIGYCPFCGDPIKPWAYSPEEKLFEWQKCRTPFCKGMSWTIFTDPFGFIINAGEVFDHYIFTRKWKAI